MSSPHDTIKELNDTIDALSEHNKDLQQQNHELTVTNYIMGVVFVITASMAIVFYNQKKQYEKDIVMTVKDIADRQHKLKKWEEFNRTHIPETALPRIKEIEAIYNERT